MKSNIVEDIKKSDIDKQIKIYLSTEEFKTKIEKIVKNKLKDNKEIEDKFVEISKNVLTQLYKSLWIKRATWINDLKNKSN